MKYRVLCITDRSDLPETELFIGLKNAGVDIEVICNPTGRYYPRLKAGNVPIIDLILSSRINPSGIKKLRRIFKTKKYDIIYCFNNKAASNALLASFNIPVTFITYRGVAGNISFLSPASWMTHLNPKVKRIICVSDSVRSYFLSLKFLCLKLNRKKPVTIYKGHDLSWYQSPPGDLAEFGIPPDAFVIGFAGRNRPNKGIKFIVNSARWLPQNTPVHYLLMGKLTKDKRLQRQINKNPLRKNFHLTGFRADAPALAASCNAFIMPSVKKEGLSRAVIEAMAYGTPPIVTNVGGQPELVVHQESGLVVPPKDPAAIADAIMNLYGNPDKAKKLGQNARQRIQTHFNSRTTVKKTKHLFEQLLAKQR
ncbi:MAG: glycosyltransferase [Dissulfuribacterales bacterium]